MQCPITTDKMLGYILEPAPLHPQSDKAPQPSENDQTSPRYRLQRLIQIELGKRTFLAVDLHSQNKVVVKLLLHGSDPIEASLAENPSLPPSQLPPQKDASAKEADTELTLRPYLDSFEVDTPLGAALALIKNYTPSAQSSAQSSAQLSVKRVQPVATTTAPQNSYGGFRVRATQNKLEIHCLQSHIREGLSDRTPAKPAIETVELWIAIILGTFGFVGGTVISTGSILYGVIVAAFLPVLFHQLTAPRVRQQQKAVLRLTHESGDRTFISLMTMIMSKRQANKRIPPVPIESTLHCSHLSIKRIKIEPAFVFSFGVDPLGAAIVITFHNPNARGPKRLRIVGSYKEIRWLSHHLTKWGDARAAEAPAQ